LFALVALHVHLSHGKPAEQAAHLAYEAADHMLNLRAETPASV
jgi:hypothetical protein